jgi:integrase
MGFSDHHFISPPSVLASVFPNPRTQKPWTNIGKQFRKACKKAKIPYGLKKQDGVIFHDLRRTFINNSRRSGVDERTAMSMSGHKTRSAHDRYQAVDDTDQLRAVEKMEQMLAKKKASGEK